MTVTELHASLGALIEAGHGELPVCYLWQDKMDRFDHWEIDELKVATDLANPNAQVIQVD